jgi:hypothetical protein
MHERGTQPSRFFGEDSGRFAVDGVRQTLFLFRPVDGVIGGGIDDQRRALISNRAADGHSVSEIDVLAGDCDDGPQRRQ